MLSQDTLLGDRYRLARRIAVGGMGEVWRAEDTVLHRTVAVKVLKSEFSSDPTFLERFRTEARTTASLQHPGIANVFDYGEMDLSSSPGSDGGAGADTAYLVMEHVDGEPLSAVLAREGRLPAPRVLDVVRQAALALSEAHRAGMVHRDVKPGNLLVRRDGVVKITDFGIARAADAVPLTQSGMVVGTAQYFSPEQAEGRLVGPASDVYSLGVVAYECLAGRLPFVADSPVAVAMMQIRDAPPPLPPDVPGPVRSLVLRTLAKDPRSRFGTGGELADAVRAVQEGRYDGTAAPAPRPPDGTGGTNPGMPYPPPWAVPAGPAGPAPAGPASWVPTAPAGQHAAGPPAAAPTAAPPGAVAASSGTTAVPPGRGGPASAPAGPVAWAEPRARRRVALPARSGRSARSGRRGVPRRRGGAAAQEPALAAADRGRPAAGPGRGRGADRAAVRPHRVTGRATGQLGRHTSRGTPVRGRPHRRHHRRRTTEGQMTTPRLLGSRYEIGETLGYGGMAEVHRGRDVRLGREVAVKVLRADLARDPSFQARFRREAQAAASLNHPAIVAVYDTGEEIGTQPYIVMEYVEGRTLREVLKAEGRLLPRRAMEIVADVCAALDFSHRNGIVHRDVKPGNVMITRAGAVKVMDFGIARAVADNAATVTQTAAVIGTAQYLSPEQARGENVDARSDVYSTGVLLFELVTGSPPFTGDSPVAVAYQHVRENAPPPSTINPDVPRELDAIVLKAMAKNPANRYQSAAEMRADLIRAINGRPVSAEPVMLDDEVTTVLGGSGRTGMYPAAGYPGANGARPGQPERRRAWGWVALGLAALLVVGLATYLTSRYLNGESAEVGVPSLANLTQAQAQQQLGAAGLKGDFSNGPSTVPQKGRVIAQDPPAGFQLKEGATVEVTIGGGPAQITLDDLKGLSYDVAAAQLQAKKLVPVRQDVNNRRHRGHRARHPAGRRPEGLRGPADHRAGEQRADAAAGRDRQDRRGRDRRAQQGGLVQDRAPDGGAAAGLRAERGLPHRPHGGLGGGQGPDDHALPGQGEADPPRRPRRPRPRVPPRRRRRP